MTGYRLDYIWLDGYQPTANIRTKSQIIERDHFDGNVDEVPIVHKASLGTERIFLFQASSVRTCPSMQLEMLLRCWT